MQNVLKRNSESIDMQCISKNKVKKKKRFQQETRFLKLRFFFGGGGSQLQTLGKCQQLIICLFY